MSGNDKNSGDKRFYSFFPKSLAGCIESLTRPVLKAQGLAGTRILTEWESIIGTQLAGHTLPEKLSFPKGKKTGGTLTISVENGFAPELQHMQTLILERLSGYFGYQAVSRIVISQNWLPALIDPIASPPLQSTLSSDCKQFPDIVEDPDLRAALSSFAKTLAGEPA